MKKTTKGAVILIVALLIVLFASCFAGISRPNSRMYDFPDAPSTREEILDVYVKEVQKRLTEYSNEGVHDNGIIYLNSFLTQEEIKFLNDNGYKVLYTSEFTKVFDEKQKRTQQYDYPILFKTETGVDLWYVSSGFVHVKTITGDNNFAFYEWAGDPLVSIHHQANVNEKFIYSRYNFAATYNESTGNVNFWEFGELTAQYEVPANSVYAGFSNWNGYIFRSGTDVYTIVESPSGVCFNDAKPGVYLLSHDVEKVLLTNYEHNANDCAQPLFLMTDGSVKVYCGPDFTKGLDSLKFDAPSYLKDVTYDGGYDYNYHQQACFFEFEE